MTVVEFNSQYLFLFESNLFSFTKNRFDSNHFNAMAKVLLVSFSRNNKYAACYMHASLANGVIANWV